MRLDEAFPSDAPWQFLMALNESSMFIPRLTELVRIPKPPPLNYSLRPKDEALDQDVRQTYVTHLRLLADEWINTGRFDGVEEPSQRKLSRTLRETLREWAAVNKPDIGFDNSGGTVLLMPVTKIDYKSPIAAAKNAAVLLFGVFLDSPYRSRLFKCLRCNSYYFTERQPRGPIKYGTYCPLHRQAASASRSNAQRRKAEHQERLKLAAQWWNRWPKRMTDEGQQAEWVASKVNSGLNPGCMGIKRNWVTRHRASIEEQALQKTILATI